MNSLSLPAENTQQQMASWIQWLVQEHSELVQAMRNSSHHYSPSHLSPWHLEGDVWSHSLLVAQAYVQRNQLDPCVGLCALLHDIGKPVAAKVLHHKKRVVFQGHESVSAWMAWRLLQNERLLLTMPEKLRIFSLIALHGCLYTGWFAEDEAVKQSQVMRAFSGFGQDFWRQLCQQVEHDQQGQITLSANRKSVVADLAQLTLAEASNIDDNHVPIVFLVGLPGAGKTNLRARFGGYCIISRDDCLHQVTGDRDYRKAWQMQEAQGLSAQIDALLNAQFQQAIQDKQPILMDMTNLTRKSRRYWLSQLPSHYSPRALLLLACDQTLAKRNQQRKDKSLDPSVIHDMMLRFEHPLFDEFEQIDYVVEGEVYGMSGAIKTASHDLCF